MGQFDPPPGRDKYVILIKMTMVTNFVMKFFSFPKSMIYDIKKMFSNQKSGGGKLPPPPQQKYGGNAIVEKISNLW